MKNKLSGILIGVTLILIGILYIFRDVLGINFTSVIFLLLGVCFLINYINKKGGLSIIPAVYLIAFSAAHIILGDTDIYAECSSAIWYFSSALLFFIWYFKSERSIILTLGCLSAALGADVLLCTYLDVVNTISMLTLCLGIGLMASYILYREYDYKAKFYLSIIMILFSAANILEIDDLSYYFIPAVFIIVGFSIIVRTLRNKDGEQMKIEDKSN